MFSSKRANPRERMLTVIYISELMSGETFQLDETLSEQGAYLFFMARKTRSMVHKA